MSDPRATADLTALEGALGHQFREPGLLRTALTHRSFANEHATAGVIDNEKLEFLGDAVLDLVIGHQLINKYPDLREGDLSVTRAQVVSEVGLSEVARHIGLGTFLFLGRGEDRSGGRDKASILADAFEAVVAAVYLDGGFEAAWKLVTRVFQRRIGGVELTGFYDFKTRLQELAQSRLKSTPTYEVIAEHGPDHAKTFEVRVLIADREWARASGPSKKSAEQHAAANAAFFLEGSDLGEP